MRKVTAWATGLAHGGVFILAMMLAALPGLAAEEKTLIVLGDSLTSGYGLPRADGFVAQLQDRLTSAGLPVRVIGASVAGETAGGLADRLAWVLDGQPQIDGAIVATGANDMLRALPAEGLAPPLTSIMTTLTEREIPVLLAGMRAPDNYGAAYVRRFVGTYRAMAEQYDAVFYPFLLEGVAGVGPLNQTDGIHPNAQGIAEILERMEPSLTQLLSRMMADKPSA